MMSTYGYGVSINGSWRGQPFSVGDVILQDESQRPEPPGFETRGRYPNAGDGPYFRIRGKLLKTYGGYPFPSDEEIEMRDGDYSCRTGVKRSGSWLRAYFYDYAGNTMLTSSYYRDYQVYPGTGGWRFNTIFDSYYYNGSKWVLDRHAEGGSNGQLVSFTSYMPADSAWSDLFDEFLCAVEADYFRPKTEQGYARAFMAAASSVPQAEVNLMANLSEAFDNIKSLINAIRNPKAAIGSLIETVTDPKEMWLSYRYVYNTNQADAKDLSNLVSRLDALAASAHEEFTLTGSVSVDDRTRICTMRYPVSSMLPSDLMDAIEMFGLRVTPSNLWDIVPFSFMVDWFAGIGDKLSFLEDWAGAVELNPLNIWFSTRAVRDGCSVYYRVPGHKPVVPPLYTEKSASGKVVTMRIADTISIFT